MFSPNFIAEPGIQKETSDASWSYLQKKVEVISEDPIKKTVERKKTEDGPGIDKHIFWIFRDKEQKVTLLVLETAEDEKVHEYNTLALAETGNSFGGIDV